MRGPLWHTLIGGAIIIVPGIMILSFWIGLMFYVWVLGTQVVWNFNPVDKTILEAFSIGFILFTIVKGLGELMRGVFINGQKITERFNWIWEYNKSITSMNIINIILLAIFKHRPMHVLLYICCWWLMMLILHMGLNKKIGSPDLSILIR